MSIRKHLPTIRVISMAVFACLATAVVHAQNPSARDTSPGASKAALTNLWMGYATQGDEELAQAIASLTRLKQWTEVNDLLSRIAGSDKNEDTLGKMAQTIGAKNLIAIKSQTALTETGVAGINMLAKALKATSEAPDRIRQAIANLSSETTDESIAATRTLLSGGQPAIVELVAAAIRKPSPANRDQILRTLIQLGSGGIDALQQLALYGTDGVKAPALECLARIDRASHAIDFLTAALAEDATPEERAVGEKNLMILSASVPTRAAGRELLLKNFINSETIAEQAKNDDAQITLWSVNDSRDGVTYQPTQRILGTYRNVADAAARLRRLGGVTRETASQVLAAEIGYRLMLDPDWGDAGQLASAKKDYPSITNAQELMQALNHAMQTNDTPAAVGLLRLIDVNDTPEADRQTYLRGAGIDRTSLVRAASSGEPRIRYEAALKVAALAKGMAFPGSSYVLRTLSEMNGLTNKPNAILVETRADTTLQAESLLSSIGYNVEIVRSVSGLQRAIRRGGDLRIVLAKTQLSDLAPIEMVDNVRRMDRGKRVPIVFYGPSSPDLGSRRWQAPTLWIDQPNSIAELENLRREVKQARRLPQMTFLDRQTYKTLAAQALAERG